MATKIITVTTKGIVIGADTPSFITGANANDGMLINATGIGIRDDIQFFGRELNYTQTEDAGVSEELSATIGKVLQDNTSFTETTSRVVGKFIEDLGGFVESRQLTMSKAITDSGRFSEELTMVKQLFLTFEEVFSISEEMRRRGIINEATGFPELRSYLLQRTYSENASFTETFSRSIGKRFADTPIAIEELRKNLTRTITESPAFSEAFTLSSQDYFEADYVRDTAPFVEKFTVSY